MSRENDDDSQHRLLSLGIVVNTKPIDTDTIEVYLAERLSQEEGKSTDPDEDQVVSSVDIDGIPFKISAKRSRKVTATWYPDGSDNRMSSPDVVAGEAVKIFRFGDSPNLLWRTYLREPALRRTEHVVYAYSNLPTGRTPFGIDSSYSATWSTKEQRVTFKTTQSNGEKFSYTFNMDARNSQVRIGDNVDNTFGIDSEAQRAFVKNSASAILDMVGHALNMSADELVALKSRLITLTGETVNITAPSTNVSGETVAINGSNSVTINGSSWKPSGMGTVPNMIIQGYSVLECLQKVDEHLGLSGGNEAT